MDNSPNTNLSVLFAFAIAGIAIIVGESYVLVHGSIFSEFGASKPGAIHTDQRPRTFSQDELSLENLYAFSLLLRALK